MDAKGQVTSPGNRDRGRQLNDPITIVSQHAAILPLDLQGTSHEACIRQPQHLTRAVRVPLSKKSIGFERKQARRPLSVARKPEEVEERKVPRKLERLTTLQAQIVGNIDAKDGAHERPVTTTALPKEHGRSVPIPTGSEVAIPGLANGHPRAITKGNNAASHASGVQKDDPLVAAILIEVDWLQAQDSRETGSGPDLAYFPCGIHLNNLVVGRNPQPLSLIDCIAPAGDRRRSTSTGPQGVLVHRQIAGNACLTMRASRKAQQGGQQRQTPARARIHQLPPRLRLAERTMAST